MATPRPVSHMLALAALAVVALATPAGAGALEDAEKAYEEDRLEEALRLSQAAVEAAPADADAVGLLGRVLFSLGRLDEAVERAGRAAELDADEWGNLGKSTACRVAFFRNQDDEVRRLLPTFESGSVTKHLEFLMSPTGLVRHQERGGHYIIYADETLQGRKGHEWAGKMMELIYEAYSTVFPFEVDPTLVSRVYLFGGGGTYGRFNAHLEKDMSDASGYFAPSTRILVIDAEPDPGDTTNPAGFSDSAIDTLFHEGFHQFVHLHVPQDIAMWFNEGMAEYFGPSTPRGRKSLNIGVVVKTGPRVTRYERVMAGIRGENGNRVLPLRQLFTADGPQFGLMEYAQSWSFIHFLLHAPSMGSKGKKLLKDYFLAVKSGKTAAEAHALTFGTLDLDKLDAAWRAYVLTL
jgi:hypothetical protein